MLDVYGQDWRKTDSIPLTQSPTSYATDFQGNLFFGFADGHLSKHDPKGKFLEKFSRPNNSSISLIDVQSTLKPFLFYFDNQQIILLDRFSSVPKYYPLSDFGLSICLMACPAPNGDFWVMENNPKRLKKINPLLKNTRLEVQVPIENPIQYMQAYQNILVIGEEQRLHIFDQFGFLIQTLNIANLSSIQLAKGVLYAFNNALIFKINPFTGKIVSTIERKGIAGRMMKSKEGFVCIDNKVLSFYTVNESK